MMRIRYCRSILHLFWILVAAAFTVAGCATNLYQQNIATRFDEAASVHVAVLSVAPWNDYVQALQPSFDLTPSDALNISLPSTMAMEEKVLDAIGSRFKVALPQISTTGSTTAGDTSKIAFEPSPAGSRTAAGLPPTAEVSQPTGVDQLLKYWAATAIYQEVQMLNRYVKDAAVHEGYTPYLVRLQVSLMPRMQDQPLDAYTTISFFPDLPLPGGPKNPTETAATYPDEVSGIRIIPLVVTDDVEMAIHNHSLDRLREFALALSAAVRGVGATGDFQRMYERLQTVKGQDLNSTFMVARVTGNTIRCRFGAHFQSESKYAMTAQTHPVTLVVLVPKCRARNADFKERTVYLVAKTTLTNPQTGKNLEPRSHAETRAETRRLFPGGIPNEKNDDLTRSIIMNDWEGFKSTVKDLAPPEGLLYKWAELTEVRLGTSYATASFTVPRDHKRPLFDGQTPLVLDDCKTSSVVKLRSAVGGLDPNRLIAKLTVSGNTTLCHTDIKVSSDGKEADIKFPSLVVCKLATKEKPDEVNKKKKSDRVEKEKTPDPVINLCVADLREEESNEKAGGSANCSDPQNCSDRQNCSDLQNKLHGCSCVFPGCKYAQVKADPQKSDLSLTANASVVIADKDRHGKLTIAFFGGADASGKSDTSAKSQQTVKKEDQKIFLTVKGADAQIAASGTSTTIKPAKDGWNVSGFGTLNLSLSNLDPSSRVKISAKDTVNDISLPDIEFPVFSLRPEHVK
ncbi:MAG TPA: hypothetical protein VEF34_04010 [Syntrophobacteraceae bacterium]|nr:hypothetical protein [Syntrophobacteraceae bacterium]